MITSDVVSSTNLVRRCQDRRRLFVIIGSLSTDVQQESTATATGVVLFHFWSVVTPSRLQRQAIDVQQELFPSVVRSKNAPNIVLPVAVHGSRTSVLKLPNGKQQNAQFPAL